MSRPEVHITPADEAAAIARLVAARLDRLEGAPDDKVAEAEERLASWPGGARLATLLTLFRCSEADRALLLTCLAPQLNPRLIPRYQAISGRPWPTEWLAGLLFGQEGAPLLASASAVTLWRLVTERVEQAGEPAALTADPAIRGWIAGSFGIEPDLLGMLRPIEPQPPLSGWPVEEVTRRVRSALARGEHAVMLIDGLEGSGRASFAATVARSLGQRCLVADPAAHDRTWSRTDTLRIHRFALVIGAAVVWRRRPPDGALWPAGLWPPQLQALALEPGESPPEPGLLAPFHVSLPAMTAEERAAMLAARAPGSAGWSRETRAALARRRALTPAALVRLGRIAPETDAEALEAANRSHASVMGDLAQRVDGALDWDDLILPARLKDDLKDLAFEAQVRAQTWTDPEVRRLFAREAGLVGLFQGPPGTGKTMAAQVIARALGLDLYRVDCSTVISKYIGETSKNMSAIFARARRIDAVLFFDEADALFSRRTEVRDSHDRHANTDTSYLLQLIEGQFEGTAILATNRMGDIDPAFVRRIRYIFEFPRPTADDRAEIWRRSAGALMPEQVHQLAPLWAILGECLEITGAQIKTTLLSAHFAAKRRAAPLGALDLLRAAEREFGKEGRTLGSREKERIRAHA